ncbi:2,4-diketo-3-deoxy-L-rhamnonate hydrolase [Halocatena marina]|uniref:2,4-diketo-3-deoxy-L-rhamnonate hydrolase n=1 Tax=Halocatena marina TaxID=2934937 RepID=UPI002010505A|nr:2,4-diketo-3-deoxy-L-rhamnonate hydrolase [Halocatena marina]
MQLVRYSAGSTPQWGVLRDDQVIPLSGLQEKITFQQLNSPGFLRVIKDAAAAAESEAVPIEDVKLLAPVPRPGKIVCVGLNYHDHAEEQDEEIPERPLLFAKAGTSVTNPDDPIVHPADIEQVDFEVELGVVIGQTAKDVNAENSFDYVAGYTAIDDVSGRDAQFEDGQYFRGKSYDTFAPIGPTFVPESDIDPHNLDVACRVNGETKQSSNTSEFIFGVDEIIEYISGIMTLRPGDVISTGTPGGVGIFRVPPELLEPDDIVTVEIEGIGALTNQVVAEDEI